MLSILCGVGLVVFAGLVWAANREACRGRLPADAVLVVLIPAALCAAGLCGSLWGRP